MNRLTSRLLSLLILFILPASILPLRAQDELTSKEEKKVIEEIANTYSDWGKAAWSGRLSADILPVSVTMKVYMEKGKLTLISLRAPLFGEVGRIEIDNDSVLVVNKMKRRYYSRSIEHVAEKAPDFAADMQALLLGRMFVIGEGQLRKKSADSVDVFPTADEGCYMVVPIVPDYLPQVVYGFATDPDYRMATFASAYGRMPVAEETPDNPDPGFSYEPKVQLQAQITYRDNDKGAVAHIEAGYSGHNYTATLTTDPIEWGAAGFDRISVEGYTRVAFKEVIRF